MSGPNSPKKTLNSFTVVKKKEIHLYDICQIKSPFHFPECEPHGDQQWHPKVATEILFANRGLEKYESHSRSLLLKGKTETDQVQIITLPLFF